MLLWQESKQRLSFIIAHFSVPYLIIYGFILTFEAFFIPLGTFGW